MYIVYITTNMITQQIYIGVHEQDDPFEFDGYLGSGDWKDDKDRAWEKRSLKEAINEYGSHNFSRSTLFYFYNEDDAYQREREIVTPQFCQQLWNYNLIPGGGKPPNHTNFVWINDGKVEQRVPDITDLPLEFKAGRLPVSDDTKQLARENSLRLGLIPPRHDKASGYWTEERKQQATKQLEWVRATFPQHVWTDEERRVKSEQNSGEGNPMYGSRFIWITNGTTNMRWTESHNNYPDGFNEGYVREYVPYIIINNNESNMSWPKDNPNLPKGYTIGRMKHKKRYVRITNGIDNKTISPDESVPDGWRRGMTRGLRI